MLRALSQAGAGTFEFFDAKTKYNWAEKVGLDTFFLLLLLFRKDADINVFAMPPNKAPLTMFCILPFHIKTP